MGGQRNNYNDKYNDNHNNSDIDILNLLKSMRKDIDNNKKSLAALLGIVLNYFREGKINLTH